MSSEHLNWWNTSPGPSKFFCISFPTPRKYALSLFYSSIAIVMFGCVCMCVSAGTCVHIWSKGNSLELVLFSPHGIWELNSGHQACTLSAFGLWAIRTVSRSILYFRTNCLLPTTRLCPISCSRSENLEPSWGAHWSPLSADMLK